MVPSEEVVVTVTKDGYVKRTSLRSHSASNGKDFAMKDSDYLIYEANLNTQHHLLLFTSKGHYIYQPVHELPDIRWKDLGQHISSIVPIDSNEEIIEVIGIETFEQPNVYVFTATRDGQIKRSALTDYVVTRYSRPIKTMNLKGDDEMIFARLVTEEEEVLLSTNTSYTIRFPMEDLPVTGVKTAGVKGIVVKDGEYLAAVAILNPKQDHELIIVTQRGAVKRMLLNELELGNRAKRGVVILKELKANPHRIYTILVVGFKDTFTIETEKGIVETIQVTNLTRADRYSNGSLRIDTDGDGAISRAFVNKMA